MLTCVVLNYNDSDTTISLYHKIKNYKIIDKIIIVDGASTDGSYKRLSTLADEHTSVLLADCNGGYGYGNNIGIRYSHSLGADYVLVANPDVEFSEKSIKVCLNMIKKTECVAIAPRINERQPAYRSAPPCLDVLSSSILLNKLFSPRYYPKKHFAEKKYCKVFALPGCLVMFDVKKFVKCGLYDEDVFLYNEELIIGKKFDNFGYKSIICLTESYNHFHSVSVKKNFKSSLKPKKILMKSHKLYLQRYCNAGLLPIILLSIIKPIAYLECMVWPWLKGSIQWCKKFKLGKKQIN